MTELEPCPFCGGEAKMMPQLYVGGSHVWRVKCRICGSEGKHCDDGFEAIEAWNTRAERTCKNIAPMDDIENEFICSVCGYTVPMFEYGPEIGEHCKGCGRKVMK